MNCVHDACLLMLAREGGLELQDTAGIAGSNDVGAELRNQFGFAIAKGFSRVRLHEIVDSRGTAADGGFGDFGELKARNASEQSARLRAHTLRVLQMAGVVKSDA